MVPAVMPGMRGVMKTVVTVAGATLLRHRAMEVQIRLEMLKDLVVMHTIPMSEEDKAVQVDRPRCQRQFPPRPRLNSR